MKKIETLDQISPKKGWKSPIPEKPEALENWGRRVSGKCGVVQKTRC